jgi:hypothetical protein
MASKNSTSSKKAKGRQRESLRSSAEPRDTVAPLFKVPRDTVHRFMRSVSYGVIGQSAGDSGKGFNFQLTDLPGYSSFTGLYDYYMITLVEVIIEQVNLGNTNLYPTLMIYPDYDDTTAPTLSNALDNMQMERFQFGPNKMSFRRSLVPHVLIGTTTTSASNLVAVSKSKQWVDCANPTVAHFGVKMFITQYNSSYTATTQLAFSARYHFLCKNPRG